jgi:hypothetical protein
MLGGNGGADEKTTVVEVRALKDLARDRIEEGLRAFGLLVVDQQCDVVALDVSPARIVDARAAEVLLQPDDRLGNTTVVKVDTVARDMADRKPVGGLEITLGQPRAVPEQLVMAIESFEGRLGDCLRARRRAGAVNSSRPRPVL